VWPENKKRIKIRTKFIKKNITYSLDCCMGLATTVNIKYCQSLIQGLMMMMIFRDVAQIVANNTKPKHKMIFDIIWLFHKGRGWS
jgi:ribose/xylose/arabinose/galactoside ABC-type transport system permease subunit